jgi:GTP-binding protein
LKIAADFVTSAAGAEGFPDDDLPEIALVGRSNVGKSSLINALTRQRLARTSAAPGKTRLANIYRVARGTAPPLYLVDLPGYGYARGGVDSAREFEELTRAYFRERLRLCRAQDEPIRGEASAKARGGGGASPPVEKKLAAVLLVDARHPGLDSDLQAWRWLRDTVGDAAVAATKIDKLARGERIRAMRQFESVFEQAVLPLSAVTGEGLDELWKLIDRLVNSPNPQPRRSSRSSNSSSPRRRSNPEKATALRLPKKVPPARKR